MRVIIIGPMASGKSVVGKKLSKKLKMSFYDTDKEIEEAAGASIAWIFDVEGEKKFRDREYQILSKVMEMENCVISTGGGIILEEKKNATLNRPEAKEMISTIILVHHLNNHIFFFPFFFFHPYCLSFHLLILIY